MKGTRHFRIGQDEDDDVVEIDLKGSSSSSKDIEMEMSLNPFHGAGAGNSVDDGLSSFDALRAQIFEMPAWIPLFLQVSDTSSCVV